MSFTLDLTATVTVDGETKSVTTRATLDAAYAASGVLTATTTYQQITAALDATAYIIYNDGSVDVSVRIGTGSLTTGYYFLNVPPGAFVIVPSLIKNDDSVIVEGGTPYVKAQSGTAEVQYCVVI